MLELKDKDFGTPSINMFKDLKEKVNIMSELMENLSRDSESIFKKEILELRSTIWLNNM